MLDYELFGGFGWRRRLALGLLELERLLLLLDELACLLLRDDMLLSLLLLAGLVAELVAAGVLSLVPPATADAGPAHHADRHLDVAPVLLVQRLGLLESLDFEIERVDLLHQLRLGRARLNCDPFEMRGQLDALIVG